MIFDTTALIHAIRSKEEFREGSISIITLIEVLRGIDDFEKRKKMETLIESAFDVIEVNKRVARSSLELYFELKKKGEISSAADELIAATARSRGESLLTSDRGFLRFQPLIRVELLPP